MNLHPRKLTKREKEIIVLIAKGKENMEIAELLFISSKTIETHRKNILRKLNKKNFYSVLSYVYKHKIIDIEKI